MHVADHRWSNEVALLEALYNQIGAVQYDFGALVRSILDDALYSLLGLRRDDWTDVGVLNVSGIDLQRLSTLNDVRNPVSRFANQNRGRPMEAKVDVIKMISIGDEFI